MTEYATLLPGDPGPWFRQRCTTVHGTYTFDMSAGRHVLLFFFRSSLEPQTAADLAALKASRDLFDGRTAILFGVSADPEDESHRRVAQDLPGTRFFWDSDGLAGRLYGARRLDGNDAAGMRPCWVVLDPMLRVLGVTEQAPGRAAQVIEAFRRQTAQPVPNDRGAPVLSLPGLFEAEFCQRLIACYEASESVASGVFTETDLGRSRAVSDPGFKRRRDCTLHDRVLVQQVQARIIRRAVPEIRKAFQFEASRLDRLILACYDAADRGCFGPHRDNTVQATAHRRFAISINLNDDFEGGEIGFPEFGPRTYRPATGGALIFSCSLMHAVSPVERGRRYACLPFAYDDAAEQLRQANRSIIRESAPRA
ncbi:redoxin domain-containing protein [Lichenicoccus sp.]|uniref:redoxin domain-containing protein n=1 Tax=Lichenicoccus sp. TaxID=2781899 RepID=UPI003D0959DF